MAKKDVIEVHRPYSGRPTSYKEEYCEMLIEHMSNGHSFDSFGGMVDVCKDTLYEWVKRHPEFSDAKKVGKMRSLLTMERVAIDAINGLKKGFNLGAWCFFMKNVHGWKNVNDVPPDISPTMTITYPDGSIETLGVEPLKEDGEPV